MSSRQSWCNNALKVYSYFCNIIEHPRSTCVRERGTKINYLPHSFEFLFVCVVHGLASFVQQKSKIGGHSNPFGGSSITYVGSVCHQSRVIWSWGAHSALTSWSRWFYTVKWSKLAIFSGLSGRFLGVVWWFQSVLLVRTCLYLDDQVKFWKKI